MKQTQQFLGIYFSRQYILMAVFDPNSQKVIIAGEFPRARDGTAEKKNDLASFLAEWGKDRMVILSPPAVETFSLYHEVPFLKKEEVETALNSFLRKGHYYKEKDYSIVYNEMDPHSGNPKRRGYFFAAIPKKYMNKESLGDDFQNLTIQRLEVAYLAYLRWLFWERPELREGTHIAVHFAPDEVMFIIFKDGNPLTTRTFFSDILKLDKWKSGDIDNLDDYEPFVRHLAKKLQRFMSWSQFRKLPIEIPIDDMILTGMNVGNSSLSQHISSVLGIPVAGFVNHKARASVEIENGVYNQRWVVAVGLSMKSMGVTI